MNQIPHHCDLYLYLWLSMLQVIYLFLFVSSEIDSMLYSKDHQQNVISIHLRNLVSLCIRGKT